MLGRVSVSMKKFVPKPRFKETPFGSRMSTLSGLGKLLPVRFRNTR
jgi:hypothetical protein